MTGAVPALVGFARMLRAAGVPAGPARVHAWARALGYLDAGRTADVYWAGRLTLCAGPELDPRLERGHHECRIHVGEPCERRHDGHGHGREPRR